MTSIQATIKGRRLELDVPADWPDGTEVEIHALTRNGEQADDPMSAEEIARTLAAMDQVIPFEMTAEEEAAWEADRRARRDFEKARSAERAEQLRRAWE
jgi:hypothetical protein